MFAHSHTHTHFSVARNPIPPNYELMFAARFESRRVAAWYELEKVWD